MCERQSRPGRCRRARRTREPPSSSAPFDKPPGANLDLARPPEPRDMTSVDELEVPRLIDLSLERPQRLGRHDPVATVSSKVEWRRVGAERLASVGERVLVKVRRGELAQGAKDRAPRSEHAAMCSRCL